MKQYLDLLRYVLDNGQDQFDERTGVGTRFVWGNQLHFFLPERFPLVTTKNTHMHSIVHELLWMISGNTNIRYLNQNKVRIWNEWPYRRYLKETGQAIPNPHSTDWQLGIKKFADQTVTNEEFAKTWGDIGPNYGYQWRHFDGYLDQLGGVVKEIKAHSTSRRLLVTAWDPRVINILDATSLPPCHYNYQFKVFEGKLYSVVTLRSWDVFLGGPFNIAQYALLTHMVAHVAGLQAQELVVESHDTHLYQNHLDLARLQLEREPSPLPKLSFTRTIDSIDDFQANDIILTGYNPHPAIKAEVAV